VRHYDHFFWFSYEYANIVWSGGNSIVLKSAIEKPTHKKAIRIISEKHRREHTTPYKLIICQTSYFNTQNVEVACFMFKVRHSELPAYFIDMFEFNSHVHMYSTRHADDYHHVELIYITIAILVQCCGSPMNPL